MSQHSVRIRVQGAIPALAWRFLNDRTFLHKALGPSPSGVACFALE